MTMPGVQKPHLAGHRGERRRPAPGASGPRSARTFNGGDGGHAASMASVMQLFTGILSSQTVQLEQTPRSQLTLVPVMPSWMRRASARVVRGSIWRVRSLPLTCSVTAKGSGPKSFTSLREAAAAFAFNPLNALETGSASGGDARALEKAAAGDAC